MGTLRRLTTFGTSKPSPAPAAAPPSPSRFSRLLPARGRPAPRSPSGPRAAACSCKMAPGCASAAYAPRAGAAGAAPAAGLCSCRGSAYGKQAFRSCEPRAATQQLGAGVAWNRWAARHWVPSTSASRRKGDYFKMRPFSFLNVLPAPFHHLTWECLLPSRCLQPCSHAVASELKGKVLLLCGCSIFFRSDYSPA